ncbi:MAG TPA: class I SAM-dependent methyltransferase [Mycobacteriales bacterium]|nr:class I SAM-dependent methyltransferase [Mycobacteriales bacterium]
MQELDPSRARVFGATAEDYERWRPAYPVDAVDWLLPPGATRVADVGAGTGKLTGVLLSRGVAVAAVEPDPAMLAVLRRERPAATPHLAPAERLPLPDASVDAVLAGQAWHWFDHAAAVAEVRRVLRPGGRLGLVWNGPRPRDRWEIELAHLDPDTRDHDFTADSEQPYGESMEVPGLPAGELEQRTFPWLREIGGAALRGRLRTHSAFVVMAPAERDALLDAMVAVVEAEAARRGTATVPLRQAAHCVRWSPR